MELEGARKETERVSHKALVLHLRLGGNREQQNSVYSGQGAGMARAANIQV